MNSNEQKIEKSWIQDIFKKFIVPLLSSYTDSSRQIGQSRVDVLEKMGRLEESYSSLRQLFNIEVMEYEDDVNIYTNTRDIGVFTASSWYRSLSEKREKEFIKEVILEIQRLELPLMIIEQYIEGVLYGIKIKVPMAPIYLLYCVSLLEDSFPLKLSTEDKRYLKMQFKQDVLKVKPKGAIPKDKKEGWNIFKSVILNKSNKKQIRRFKNMKAKLASLGEKRETLESVGDDRDTQRIHKDTYLDLVTRAYDDEDGSRDKQHVQNLKKHKERIEKYIKKTRE